MIFTRRIENNLFEWKTKAYRKPLILRGGRQVGKTTLIKSFAKTYKYSITLNLEKKPDRVLFQDYNDAKTIVESLLLSRNIPSNSLNETLVFIDEIQELPEAIQMLRYFYEEVPELHVIAAGSLLEFAMHKVKSFPVGRVEFLQLYPLNFGEYLEAIQHEAALNQLKEIPVKSFAHNTMIELFNRYAIIGGMPEVIKIYNDRNSLLDLPGIYESIWETYRDDVEKYALSEPARNVIKYIMSVAPLYLDQRIKFQNFGKSNYKSREVGEAMRNLDEARIIQLIYPTTDMEVPIKPDIKKSPRLQFLDTGLVNHALNIQSDMLGLKDFNSAYRGAIIPHLITQELMSLNTYSNKKPNFWVREKHQASSEVDLVYAFQDKVIPIEIKSGGSGTLRSLHQFIEGANHPYAVRVYAGEFKVERTNTPGGTPYFLMNLPYYLGTKIPQYIEYFLGNY
jgi:hypothetical protein